MTTQTTNKADNSALLTKPQKDWILYDVGNSAFSLVIITAVMPIFFKDYSASGMDSFLSTAKWGYANGGAALIIAFLSPFMGALSDVKGYKKRLFALFVFFGVSATLVLALTGKGEWLFCMIVFAAARIGWGAANIFYDSMLVDVADFIDMDSVSAKGYAWGYIGSAIPFLTVICMIMYGQTNSNGEFPGSYAKAGFLIVAFWWAVFTFPMLRSVKIKTGVTAETHILKHTCKRLKHTIINIKSHKNVVLFLAAYFFYIDGVDTIISMSAAYGLDSGLSAAVLIIGILVIQIVAFPSALIFGKLAGTYGAKKLIFVGIAIYALITGAAFFLPLIKSMSQKTAAFFVLALMVAAAMGGIQSLSRSLFASLIPPEQSGEFFGFYNIFGKFAAITGPLLMGLTSQLTGSSRYGILSIFVLFATGGLFLWKVKTRNPQKI